MHGLARRTVEVLRTEASLLREGKVLHPAAASASELDAMAEHVRRLAQENHVVEEWLTNKGVPSGTWVPGMAKPHPSTLAGRMDVYHERMLEQRTERGRRAWDWLTAFLAKHDLPEMPSLASVVDHESRLPEGAGHVARFGLSGYHREAECTPSGCPGRLKVLNGEGEEPELLSLPREDFTTCPKCGTRAAGGSRQLVTPEGRVQTELFRHCQDCGLELRIPRRLRRI